jgi:uncharacterized membrane protein
MKSIMLILFFSLSASSQEIITDIIEDPSVSVRCKEMIKVRNDKIHIKQKMSSLLKRTNGLMTKTPKEKKTSSLRLQLIKSDIKNELLLTSMLIKSMEEEIVRRGCPGIRL